jgi:hypothetical protein
MSSIEVEQLVGERGGRRVLHGLDFEKTTLMRAIVGVRARVG